MVRGEEGVVVGGEEVIVGLLRMVLMLAIDELADVGSKYLGRLQMNGWLSLHHR